MKRTVCLIVAVALLAALPTAAAAQATREKALTAEEYVDLARPFLHLSCEGAWSHVEMDDDAYIALIDKISAIGFLNHSFDIDKLEDLPADKLEAIRVEYYSTIGNLCRENPQKLLAGIIDEALIHAFSLITPED